MDEIYQSDDSLYDLGSMDDSLRLMDGGITSNPICSRPLEDVVVIIPQQNSIISELSDNCRLGKNVLIQL